jgi:predicted kinase
MNQPSVPALIIIRGNSGSGKSTLAREVRQSLAQQDIKAALVEQDYLRRTLLKEREVDGGDNIDLIEQTVRFALKRGYWVVLEGMLVFARYGAMLTRLVGCCDRSFVYWMDISFEETLRRHRTKPNAHEFGEPELRRWWNGHDVSQLPGERVIPAEWALYESVRGILADVGLTSGASGRPLGARAGS